MRLDLRCTYKQGYNFCENSLCIPDVESISFLENIELNKPIIEAAQQNNLAAVKLLNATNKDIHPELRIVLAQIAVEKNNLEMLKFLSKKNFDFLKHDGDFKNSILLRSAIFAGFLQIIKYLVDECKVEALASHCPTSGDTFVHLTAELGHLDILKFFVEEKKVKKKK